MNDQAVHADNLKPGSNRSFGFVFAALFLLVAVYPVFKGADIRLWALVLGGCFGLIAAWRPAVLAPFNLAWFKFGLLLGKVVTPVVMFVLFAAVVVPTGLVMRLLGRDPLTLHLDPSAKTYWIPRAPQAPASDTLRNQF